MTGYTSRARFAVLPFVLALAACGSGGGDDDPPPELVVSGVAATGAALAGYTVTLDCQVGNHTVKSGDDGSFRLSIVDATLPCVLVAASPVDETLLYSIVPGAGEGDGEVVAHITPLTHLLVAQIAGVEPNEAEFADITPLDAERLAAAQAAVLAALQRAGVDTEGLDNLLSDELVAGSGEGHDGVLDALQDALNAAELELIDLANAIAATSADGDAQAAVVATLFDAGSADCPSLKNGAHRVVSPSDNETFIATVDTGAMTVKYGGKTMALVKNKTCDFTVEDGEGTRVLVAGTGMAVWRTGEGLEGYAGVSVPVQPLDVATVAGSYNRVSYGANGSVHAAGAFGTATFDGTGLNTTGEDCTSLADCVVDPRSKGQLVANDDGGFDLVKDGAAVARLFGFMTTGGRSVLVGLETDGSFHVFAPQRTLAVHDIGTKTSFWQFTASAAGGTGVLKQDTWVATAYDGRLERTFASDGSTDRVTYNHPFSGLRSRKKDDCGSAGGGERACNASVQLPLPGPKAPSFAVNAGGGDPTITVTVVKP